MSDSVRPHRQQPTRLPRPWDSPGKNTGVGCHFLPHCMKVKSEREVPQSCLDCLRPHGLQPARLLHPWDFPGKSTGVGCHCLLPLWPLRRAQTLTIPRFYHQPQTNFYLLVGALFFPWRTYIIVNVTGVCKLTNRTVFKVKGARN